MIFYIIVILTILIGDSFIKEYIEDNKKFGEKEEIFGGKIILEKYHNKGAMLNVMEKSADIVKLASGTMIGILLVMFGMLLSTRGNKVLKLGFSLILGGALSNFVDRITKGHVTDYFSFSFLKRVIFNISDICVFLGSFLILLRMLGKQEDEK